jgi:flagellar basal body-associated protein FliL
MLSIISITITVLFIMAIFFVLFYNFVKKEEARQREPKEDRDKILKRAEELYKRQNTAFINSMTENKPVNKKPKRHLRVVK